jgi:FlaA1/EpsC-like NDP-sugar epimerase
MPVKICDMARDLIRLSGKEPETDIQIEFTGLRPGEKLYEELYTQNENVIRTRHEKIMVVKSNGITGKADRYENFYDYLKQQTDDLLRTADSQNAVAIRRKLQELIPEFGPQTMGNVVIPKSASGNGNGRDLKVA